MIAATVIMFILTIGSLIFCILFAIRENSKRKK